MKAFAALALTGALALAAAPAVALPPQASDKAASGQEHRPTTPAGPPDSTEPKGKAFGVLCQDESKKKREGQKKSDFAMCVTAMAKAERSEDTSAREACKGMSKKHVKGEKGTPFSRCVVAAAQLKED